MNKNYLFGFAFLFILVFIGMVSATLNVSLSDQGTEVTNTTSGALLSSGDLTVLVYDALTGGNLIYTETFSNAIGNGTWNVMLGEIINLPLEFGRIYYKDYLIAGEDASFVNGTGQTVGRQFFYSPLGDINSSKVFGAFTGATNSTNGTTGIVPNPQSGEQGQCLKGDGTWGDCGSDFVCPTGFTMIETNGFQMGCMQNTRQGTGVAGDDCQEAILECYSVHGGRLPTYNEIYIAVQNYSSSLTDEGVDEEWTDVGFLNGAQTQCGLIEESAASYIPSGNPHTSDFSFRCFIPAGGGGGNRWRSILWKFEMGCNS